MATLRQAFPSKWLKAEDLGGVDMPATVKLASWESIQAPGEAPEQKIALHFAGPLKPLVLNATNFKAMVKITGQEDSDHWGGAQILLTTEQATFGGKVFPAVRIAAMPAQKNAAHVNAALEQAEVESPYS